MVSGKGGAETDTIGGIQGLRADIPDQGANLLDLKANLDQGLDHVPDTEIEVLQLIKMKKMVVLHHGKKGVQMKIGKVLGEVKNIEEMNLTDMKI